MVWRARSIDVEQDALQRMWFYLCVTGHALFTG